MVHIIDHPLIKHKLTIMRKKETCSKDFRENLDEIASLMAYEVTKNVSLREINITTPICDTIGYEVKDNILIVPILRAGLGLVDGFKKVIPTASIGHIGLARDEVTFKPFEYLCKLPTIHEDTNIIVVDPMLATGLSMEVAYKALLSHGTPKNVHVACLFGTPQAINYLSENMPDNVTLWCAVVDPMLNEKKYIVPGLGDAGDLCFGEKL